MEQIIIYYIIAVISALCGYVAASIFSVNSRKDEFEKGYRIGRTKGYTDGYINAHNMITSDSVSDEEKEEVKENKNA
ncbi:MAG: hypothetical protein ACOC2F_07830 [Bacteroidota bacterium]